VFSRVSRVREEEVQEVVYFFFGKQDSNYYFSYNKEEERFNYIIVFECVFRKRKFDYQYTTQHNEKKKEAFWSYWCCFSINSTLIQIQNAREMNLYVSWWSFFLIPFCL
jgi:hypothetical protein